LRLIKQLKPDSTLIGVDIRQPHAQLDFEFHQLEPQGTLSGFVDDTLDVVISFDVLEHVGYLQHTLDEISRVLRRGGAFIGFVPLEGGFSPHSFFRLFNDRIYRDTKDHHSYFTNWQMKSLLLAHFEIVQLEYSYHLFGALMDAVFFASFKLPGFGSRIEQFWRGTENPEYRQVSGGTSTIARLTKFASTLAYYESRQLRNVPFGATGLLFHVRKPGCAHHS
jgi:SAM-dependent methyltransferase